MESRALLLTFSRSMTMIHSTMIHRIGLSIILVLMMSCTKDKPEAPSAQEEPSPETAPASSPASSAGSRTLAIVPENADVGSTLSVRASGFTLPSAGGDDRLVWLLNGSPVSSADPLILDLREHLASKGDTVEAVAHVGGEQISSGQLRVSNSPPRITDTSFHDPGEASGNFSIDVQTEDADGDSVTLEYQWTVNGIPAGTEKQADLSPSPADRIEVSVRAYDGEDYSQESREEFTLLNRAPRFDRVEQYHIVGSTYIYNASASDPDHEPVIFSLDSEPPGMTIDPDSGQVRWDVPDDFFGTVEYYILAADDKGLKSVLPMKFSVLKE